MAEHLSALSPLDGYDETFGELRVAEVTGLALVAIAVPPGGHERLAEALAKQYRAAPPDPGRSVLAADKKARLIWVAPDQYFLAFAHPDDHAGPGPEAMIREKLGDAAYLTDQSDAWVMLRLAGSASRAALARLCPLDLDPAAFPEGAAARTVMEHLGAFIIRESADSYLLLSARSSAGSFLHAVTVSVENIR